jgi:hypothetical protein
MTLSSFKIVRATYSFVWGNRLEFLRILWLPLLLMFLLAWIVWPHIFRFVNACVRAAAVTSISSSSAVALSLWVLLLFAGITVLASIICAGLWRLVLRKEHVKAPFYLGFGKDELRLLALAGVKVLVLLAWTLLTAAVIGLVELVVAHFSGFSPSALLLTLLVSLPVLGWIDTRLSLSGPAAIERQHINLSASWHSTDHNITSIRRVGALVMAPAAIAILLLLFLVLFLSMHGITAAVCTQYLARFQYLLPSFLLLLYLLLLYLVALFITARALEYQELSTP